MMAELAAPAATVATPNSPAPAANPAQGQAPTKHPVPMPEDNGLFNVWMRQIVMPAFGAGGVSNSFVAARTLTAGSTTLVMLLYLLLSTTLYVIWLRRSGYAHAARSDASALFNLATPKKAGYLVAIYGIGNSSFYGVRNTKLTNAIQGRR